MLPRMKSTLSLLQNFPFTMSVYPVSCHQAVPTQDATPDMFKRKITTQNKKWSKFTPSFTKPLANRT